MVAGIGLTFGLWWCYFMIPSGPILERHRERSFPWGYGHMLVYGAIAATGAGLHVAAFVIDGTATIGVTGAVASTVVPVAVFFVALFGIYSYLAGEFDPFHIGLFVGTLAVLVAAVGLAAAGASLGTCLIVITLAPAVVVVGYELVGHRHQADMLVRTLGRPLDDLDEEDVAPVPNG